MGNRRMDNSRKKERKMVNQVLISGFLGLVVGKAAAVDFDGLSSFKQSVLNFAAFSEEDVAFRNLMLRDLMIEQPESVIDRNVILSSIEKEGLDDQVSNLLEETVSGIATIYVEEEMGGGESTYMKFNSVTCEAFFQSDRITEGWEDYDVNAYYFKATEGSGCFYFIENHESLIGELKLGDKSWNSNFVYSDRVTEGWGKV
eukprot:Awhi_evm2s3359